MVTTLYEQDELALVTGGPLRPGGIALTTEILTSCNRILVPPPSMLVAAQATRLAS